MKKLLALIVFSIFSLLASDRMIYQRHTTVGKTFKIYFENDLIFDACNCGCPKGATKTLATWKVGDEIEVRPFRAGKKGHTYLLKNSQNETEVFSWFKDTNSRFSTIIGIDHDLQIIKTADGRYWTVLNNRCSWKIGDRIAVLSSLNIPSDERFLINLDSKDQPHTMAATLLSKYL